MSRRFPALRPLTVDAEHYDSSRILHPRLQQLIHQRWEEVPLESTVPRPPARASTPQVRAAAPMRH